MKKQFITSFLAFTLIIIASSCKNNDDSKKITNIEDSKIEKGTEDTKTKDSDKNVVIDINTKDVKIDKTGIKDFKVGKDEKPATKEEINTMVSNEKSEKLDKYQIFVQEFISACAQKDYKKAAKYIAYNGKDKSRVNKESFNPNNANEMNIVKATVDVVYGFLAESKDYKFISSKDLNTPAGKVKEIEVSFFKKGLGINRRFFDIANTSNGLIISDMK